MIKPSRLKSGDTVAIVSLSSGIAGDHQYIWRTLQGINNLKQIFGLQVKVMPNALKGSRYLKEHPEARAADLNEALVDPEIKGIINCIGGDDAHTIIPFINSQNIKKYPKIFSGYSDTTSLHLLFYKMGIVSYYGPALLTDFAENGTMDEYTIQHIKHCWFETHDSHNIYPAKYIRTNSGDWGSAKGKMRRGIMPNHNYEVLNGNGTARGKLFGGNLETLLKVVNDDIYPIVERLKGTILFLETSEIEPSLEVLTKALNVILTDEVLAAIEGIIIGKPYLNRNYECYKNAFIKRIKQSNNQDIPILYNLSFGHNEPKMILPYGLYGEIDCKNKIFKLFESTVSLN